MSYLRGSKKCSQIEMSLYATESDENRNKTVTGNLWVCITCGKRALLDTSVFCSVTNVSVVLYITVFLTSDMCVGTFAE